MSDEPALTGDPATVASARAAETTTRWGTVDRYLPSAEELRISARLVVHLARQPRLDPGSNGIPSLTQEGMATALGTTPASVSHALGRLLAGEVLTESRRHVSGRSRRARVYQLTPAGEELARHILDRMAVHAVRSMEPTLPPITSVFMQDSP